LNSNGGPQQAVKDVTSLSAPNNECEKEIVMNSISTRTKGTEGKLMKLANQLKWMALSALLLTFFCAAASVAQAQSKEPYQYQMTDDLNYDNSGKPVLPQVFKLPLPAPGKTLVIENVNVKIRMPQGQNCLCTLVTESPRVPTSEPAVSLTMPSVLAFHEYGPSGLDVRVINQTGPLYVLGNQAPDDFFLKCERSSPGGYGQIRVTVIGYVMDAPQR
jgi:hypothetical protein